MIYYRPDRIVKGPILIKSRVLDTSLRAKSVSHLNGRRSVEKIKTYDPSEYYLLC